MANPPMLEHNQSKITELHNRIAELYEEINQVRADDLRERKKLREMNRVPKLEKQRATREKHHWGMRLWNRWEEWEVELIKRGVSNEEIAKVTGRSLLSVESKIHKLKYKYNQREFLSNQ